ncbi:precorrin-2 C(20)-methyltransferase [Nitrospira moscoviensis]|jgi:precorrin-2/cobalt-factor-2 C20-methyltransferase|uniref:Precorrin-2 C(20)-methyltransferase n=1 Tax=Nitrospira moscoviensis TaxID=42253 RepID=A0A0K2GAM2_NITMO|nr:precorrin-2 C(20)-methyltransferase [Nitrospira moscoviensis]ALA58021.1 Precorrin-2 C(20)-methyltransferase [Nitrospira moscoviensis]MDI3461514.1 cobalt-precorrin-6B C15-methyltransferase [decarboxylating] [Nitrospira sp.]
MNYGILYGVGVGPGAPDLITLRALNTIRNAQVLALPRSSDYGESMAWKILKPTLGEIPGQERLFLTFPMNKDPERLRPAWDVAFAAIGERLERGLSVAFATEGDPSLFSTFIYLRREAPRRWPGIRIEVVPGVSSIVAVPSVTGIPLADGQERIAILPASYGVEDLSQVLEMFDTIILMKMGAEIPKVVDALERQGLVDRAVYVSKATMAEERIVRDIRTIQAERGDCFAMIVVSRKVRSGLLAGAVPVTPRVATQETRA